MRDTDDFPTYQKPCPVCDAPPDRVAYLLVGYPAMTEQLTRALEAGTVAIGGCLPPVRDWRDSDTAWECGRCNSCWVTRPGRKTPVVVSPD